MLYADGVCLQCSVNLPCDCMRVFGISCVVFVVCLVVHVLYIFVWVYNVLCVLLFVLLCISDLVV